ncbi:sugar ABC transporter ATP-binding protein [Microtetraspora sp. AC03309]|uniref:sugar ABC transporter ATP-binding protein n=1 Tax=Microtetraspora sp. AC03309 TaxID=2779376 RepID=UPI001E43B146|nr:sugar ABC transporter ATP-binding protein [Microtetraspora sp. AC03309]MCC5574652.1 sugar ABC transporter ATP-binding protein [Microtetraspora sp. AC03309]
MVNQDPGVPPAPETGARQGGTGLCARGITKSYGGTQVLKEVDFDVAPGEVVALLGGNGAGKSTLVKVLTGAVRPDGGAIRIDGVETAFTAPKHARDAGVAVVHQHTQLFADQSIAWNVYAGHLPRRRGLLDVRALHDRAEALGRRFGTDLDMRRPASSLDAPGRKIVEILRALTTEPRYLLLDEPTAALEPRESRRLFDLVENLVGSGTGIVLISHRLAEVLETADRVVGLRDGANVGTLDRTEMTGPALIRLVAGTDVAELDGPDEEPAERVRLAVKSGRLRHGAAPFELSLRSGEIVSCVGLTGSGIERLVGAIAGCGSLAEGTIVLDGRPVRLSSPRVAQRLGIGYVPGDRAEAVQPERSVAENLVLPALDRFSTCGWMRRRRIAEAAEAARSAYDIKCASLDAPISTLSGGNQQKVVIARWLMGGTKVLVLNEPTQGVDVSARAQIHENLHAFAGEGGAVLMATTDLPEARALSHRILAVHNGEVSHEFDRSDGTPSIDDLTAAMTGVTGAKSPETTSMIGDRR